MHYVYVLQNVVDPADFYLGYSSDLKQRVSTHNAGGNFSTRGRRWRLVYYEAYLNRASAAERERILKHDGRTRRHLMVRIREMLERESSEPFNGGERQTGE